MSFKFALRQRRANVPWKNRRVVVRSLQRRRFPTTMTPHSKDLSAKSAMEALEQVKQEVIAAAHNTDDKTHDHGSLHRAFRTDPTRELNYTHEQWGRHKSVWRHIRHVVMTPTGSVFQRLVFPDLFTTASIAAGLTFYNQCVADAASQIFISNFGNMSGSALIGLLCAYRLNASYGRYDEARKILGEVNNASRDLAGNALLWLDTQDQKERMLNLAKAFPVALHWHVNQKGGHYKLPRSEEGFQDQLIARYRNEMRRCFEDENNGDLVRICKGHRHGSNVPLMITTMMRDIIGQQKENGDPIYNRELDSQVSRLVGCLGQCERLLRTPLPSSFTRHTSRLLFLWSTLLPLGMYPACGVYTLPASVVASYFVLGIEDVGVQLEEPFNILPVRQYSQGVFDGVNTIMGNYNINISKLPDTGFIGGPLTQHAPPL